MNDYNADVLNQKLTAALRMRTSAYNQTLPPSCSLLSAFDSTLALLSVRTSYMNKLQGR